MGTLHPAIFAGTALPHGQISRTAHQQWHIGWTLRSICVLRPLDRSTNWLSGVSYLSGNSNLQQQFRRQLAFAVLATQAVRQTLFSDVGVRGNGPQFGFVPQNRIWSRLLVLQ